MFSCSNCLIFCFLQAALSKDPCFRYIKCNIKDRCGCGIPSENIDNTSNSRIINAEPSKKHEFPWLARVQLKVKSIGTGGVTSYGISSGGGAIITKNSIITAGHVLCIDDMRKDAVGGGFRYMVTCPQRQRNMNQEQWNAAREKTLTINF